MTSDYMVGEKVFTPVMMTTGHVVVAPATIKAFRSRKRYGSNCLVRIGSDDMITDTLYLFKSEDDAQKLANKFSQL